MFDPSVPGTSLLTVKEATCSPVHMEARLASLSWYCGSTIARYRHIWSVHAWVIVTSPVEAHTMHNREVQVPLKARRYSDDLIIAWSATATLTPFETDKGNPHNILPVRIEILFTLTTTLLLAVTYGTGSHGQANMAKQTWPGKLQAAFISSLYSDPAWYQLDFLHNSSPHSHFPLETPHNGLKWLTRPPMSKPF